MKILGHYTYDQRQLNVTLVVGIKAVVELLDGEVMVKNSNQTYRGIISAAIVVEKDV